MFAMYQAELARILQLTCAEIGQLATGKQFLDPDSQTGRQAIRFVRLYNLLYDRFQGDEAAICHWLRVGNQDLNGIPLYLMVDEGQLMKVIEYLEQKIPVHNTSGEFKGGSIR